MGGTELLKPLQDIFNKNINNNKKWLYVLTDGAVFNVKEIKDEIQRNIENYSVNSFGIGSGASRDLILAMATGKAYFVTENDNLERKVIEALKRSTKKCFRNPSIKFSNNELLKYIVPKNIFDIYEGDPMTIFAIVKHDIEYVTFSCKSPFDKKDMQFQINLNNDIAIEGDSIFKIAAKNLMIESDDVKEIKELSLK